MADIEVFRFRCRLEARTTIFALHFLFDFTVALSADEGRVYLRLQSSSGAPPLAVW